MSQFTLEIAISNLSHFATTHDEAFQAGTLTDARVLLQACEAYDNLGCGLLLLNHDSGGFRQQLNLSAQLYFRALQEKAQRQWDPYYMCRSMGHPMLSAVAARNFSLAFQVSQLMPKACLQGSEYDDDFLYFCMLELLLAPQRDESHIESTLGAFFSATDQGATLHYQVVEAICEKNQAQFEESFVGLIDERELSFAEKNLKPDFAITGRYIFIEGVALAQLAREHGLTLEDHYATIPDISL